MKLVITILSLLSLIQLEAQENQFIPFRGTIVNAETAEPVAGKVTFEMLPDGNDIGNISSDSKGIFTFYMRKDQSYKVSVNAEGFLLYTNTYKAEVNSEDGSFIVEVKLKAGGEGHVFRLENLVFEFAKAVITPESHAELDELVQMMESNPKMVIQFEGHTDYKGGASQGNMQLSQMRADACKNYLVSKGIKEKRILTKAFGGTRPLIREDTEEAHAMNRRVEVRILKWE